MAGVTVGVGVFVLVGVIVGVGVLVAVGVIVGVLVTVGVAVDPPGVTVGVGVLVLVDVGVGVGEGVGVQFALKQRAPTVSVDLAIVIPMVVLAGTLLKFNTAVLLVPEPLTLTEVNVLGRVDKHTWLLALLPLAL